MDQRLTLARAIKEGRLSEFIAQEEKRGVKVDRKKFDDALEAAVKPPQSKRQTSRSQGGGSSRGK